MFEVGGFRSKDCGGVSRRAFLTAGALAPFALSLPWARSQERSKARAVIVLWLWGGPSHSGHVRPQTQCGGRVSRPIWHDRDEDARRAFHRTLSPAGCAQRSICPDSFAQNVRCRSFEGRDDRPDRSGRGQRGFAAELRLGCRPASRGERSACLYFDRSRFAARRGRTDARLWRRRWGRTHDPFSDWLWR